MTADRPPLAEGVPDRLYGRRRGHPLRPRQQLLLDATLPRLRITAEQARDPVAVFGMPGAPLWVEIGFGGGEHALEQIETHKDVAYIACEVFENGLCSLLTRLVAEGEEATGALPANLRLWPKDARHLLTALPEAALDRLFLMFPDPWPKSRHAKRRFVHPSLLPLVARALRRGGEWRVASDDPTYQGWVEEVMADAADFALVAREHARPAGWPGTRYEAKAFREGRSPIYWTFARR